MDAARVEALGNETRLRRRDVVIGIAAGALVLAVVAIFGLRMGATASKGPTALQVGSPAPEFSLPMAGGETLTLADLKGRPTWINFWATWCPPCRTEMPDLQEAYAASPPGRYNLLAIDMGEDAASVQRYLNEVGYTLPVALDETGDVSLRYRVLGLPTHFFIDKDGVIKEIYVGALKPEEIRQRVAALW
ncbi:MAG: TlpA family protein disulfide reductase [Chloroflexi bacterium]|nr:TlpA family protein disulfide reductase [Chloroflexota bacterium]